MRDRHRVVFDRLDRPGRLELLEDLLARRLAGQAPEPGRNVLVQIGVLVEDGHHFEPVAPADLEIVEVVRRRDLDRAGTLLGVGIFVRDDGEPPAHDGQDRELADEIPVAFVIGMDRHRGVAQHGFQPGGRDRDRPPLPVFDGIGDVPELALDFPLFDLEVRDRGVKLGIPVDQALVAIDQAVLVQPDEHRADGPRQAVIHGEALPAPVAGRAEPAQLAGDRAARFRLPVPDAVDERLAAEIVARLSLGLQLALDHHLRGDSRVVGSRLPEGVLALHPGEADQDVLERVVERMPHVKAARDVGRRDNDRIGGAVPLRVPGTPAGKRARRFPSRVDAIFDFGGPIGLVHRCLGKVYEIPNRLSGRR